MKLTAILLLLVCLLSGLQGEAQTVTISVKNAKLGSVLKGFKKQTGYSFFYNEALLEKGARVTLNLKDTPLPEALEACFRQQPALYFNIIGQTVTIAERPAQHTPVQPAPPPVQASVPEGITMQGTVYNKKFEALVNASVMIKGSTRGTSTATNGSFRIDNLKATDVLVVSYIGYKNTELKLSDQLMVSVILEEATDQLDEVVAQGYSKTTKRFSTSSVSKISAAEIGDRPVMNPLLALQGRVPGMVLTPVSSYAAAPITIEIRGRGLLGGAGGAPLIVIDGTPLPGGNSPAGAAMDGPVKGLLGGISPALGQSPLFGLNPRDIESIEVLKDVGATAIYGSSGANGVILITTKKPKGGNASMDVNLSYGINRIIRYWDMLNTPQYLEMRREAFRNEGVMPTPVSAPELLVWDTTRYTNWQKMLWGKTGKVMDASVSLSGGNPQFSHRIAANYGISEDITTFSGKDKMAGLNLALSHKSNDQKFTATFSGMYGYTYSNMIRTTDIAKLPPNAPPLFTEEGKLNFKPWNDAGMGMYFSVFENMAKPYEIHTNNITSNLSLSYRFTNSLLLLTSIGYTSNTANGDYTTPIASQNPAYNPQGSILIEQSRTTLWNVEPQISYETRLFGKGKFNALAGATIKQSKSSSTSIIASGFTDDAMIHSMKHATSFLSYNQFNPYKYSAIFGRVSYIWDGKYVLESNIRRDGSSRFGPGNRFGNFGSAGLTWIASEEPWVKKIIAPAISFLKFYGNTGLAGEDGGQDYQYLSQWGKDFVGLNYDNQPSLMNMHAVNQDYHWQVKKELNLGVNAVFFKSRLDVKVNYYRNRLSDQLVNNPTPMFTGFPAVYGNWGAIVENKGWEADVMINVVNTKKFSWITSFNAGFNKNTIISFPDIEHTSYYTNTVVGRSLRTIDLLQFAGVDPMTGQYQYHDYNHDGKITMKWSGPPLDGTSDFQYPVDLNPVVTGGIYNTFQFGSFGLQLGFDYSIQKGPSAFSSVQSPGGFGNIPVEIFNNRWQKPGDISRYGKFMLSSVQQGLASSSTMVYKDASYLRLQNVLLNYSIPEKFIKRLGLNAAYFNFNANNLFYFTKYEGIDPELKSFGSMPPKRTMRFTLNLQF